MIVSMPVIALTAPIPIPSPPSSLLPWPTGREITDQAHIGMYVPAFQLANFQPRGIADQDQIAVRPRRTRFAAIRLPTSVASRRIEIQPLALVGTPTPAHVRSIATNCALKRKRKRKRKSLDTIPLRAGAHGSWTRARAPDEHERKKINIWSDGRLYCSYRSLTGVGAQSSATSDDSRRISRGSGCTMPSGPTPNADAAAAPESVLVELPRYPAPPRVVGPARAGLEHPSTHFRFQDTPFESNHAPFEFTHAPSDSNIPEAQPRGRAGASALELARARTRAGAPSGLISVSTRPGTRVAPGYARWHNTNFIGHPSSALGPRQRREASRSQLDRGGMGWDRGRARLVRGSDPWVIPRIRNPELEDSRRIYGD
ncbi:hypothetical protein B0H17DRAFT_1134568 [Mycena rosella]|uniref:Uncharacterized protein n=1 Tax=Mycena rosella TaxID=1033263 RepID=A0AAD7GGR1_MYCRO|nr:hypothetical protein B0H17DRAFT_1134568 [Mycena rosella]